MNDKVNNNSIFEAQVRNYEVDVLGIVNNAHYLNYFDYARHLYVQDLDINWFQLHNQGFDLVVVHVDLTFKKPLKADDYFFITSEIEPVGKHRLLFKQSLYHKQSNTLYTQALSTIVCVNKESGKVCMPDAIIDAIKALKA